MALAFSTPLRQRKEPTSFFVARCAVLVLCFIALLAATIVNIIHYNTAPHILQSSDVDTTLHFPSLLISADSQSNDSIVAECRHVYQNVSASSTNFQTQVSIPLMANPKRNVDFMVRESANIDYSKSVNFLLNTRTVLPNIWSPPFNGSQQQDLYVICSVTIDNPTNTEPTVIVGGMIFEDQVGSQTVPVFSGRYSPFILANRQYLNVYLTASLYSQGSTTVEFDVNSAQSIPTTLNAAVIGNATEAVAIFSIQLSNLAANAQQFVATMNEDVPSYGYLEVGSSVISLFNLLITLYFILLGMRRLQTLGWVQRYLLQRDTQEYITRIQSEHPENSVEGLRNMMFSVYLNGNGVREHISGTVKQERRVLL